MSLPCVISANTSSSVNHNEPTAVADFVIDAVVPSEYTAVI
jgi:hypothetical protein